MTLHERYPDADTLGQRRHWDDATRRVVLDRVHNVPEFHFFDEQQRATVEALCACVLPQNHHPADRRVPIAPWIDARCAGHHNDGFRLDDMPSNEQAWTWGLQGLDETATALFGEHMRYSGLPRAQQHRVLERVRAGDPPGEVWKRMPARRWWVFVALRQITAIYYAHPYAWDEIGFGGPAYPRGYFALNFGYPEPWEPREVGEQAGRSLQAKWRFP
jgi:gluconate 2-dehydrogenase subunit 3-like protein